MSHGAVFAIFVLAPVIAVEEQAHSMCTTQLECVRQFRRAFDLKVAVTPQHAAFNEESKTLSCTYLIFEELQELEQGIDRKSLYDVTDALVDIQYVLNAAAICFGIDLGHELNRHHGSDMAKLIRSPQPRHDVFAESPREVQQHLKLIMNAMWKLRDSITMKSFLGMSAALVDIQYEVFRAGAVFGIDLDRAFDIVHRANMAKLCLTKQQAMETVEWYQTNHNERYKSPAFAGDGTYFRVFDAASGKPLKCIGWMEPDFSPIGIRQVSRHEEL